jgi:tRNA pseudouridine38-40 synthase
VAHVDVPVAIPPGGLVRGLNNILSPEVRIRSARPVGLDFHARKSARGKRYTYRARWRESSLPWLEMRSATVMKVVDMSALAAALKFLPGTHDWASFTVPDQGGLSTVRKLFRVQLHSRANGLDLDFFGEGFLRYQVRRLVGALLEVGRGGRTVDNLQSLIVTPEPGAAVWTAPARGLTLERVYYRPSPNLEFD